MAIQINGDGSAWDIAQRGLVVCRSLVSFLVVGRCYWKGLPLKMAPIRCPETSVAFTE
jgi:hypothetical protein